MKNTISMVILAIILTSCGACSISSVDSDKVGLVCVEGHDMKDGTFLCTKYETTTTEAR